MSKLQQLRDELAAQGYTETDLDALVHDAASEIASTVNNKGVKEQIDFLLRNNWTPEDILGRLKNQREDAL